MTPEEVTPILSRHALVRGHFPMVLDLEKSTGVWLEDRLENRRRLDLFGFVASSALGMNHPGMLEDAAFMRRLMDAALNNVTNSDVLTEHQARFVQTFERFGMPDYLPYVFFVAGGANAIENGLKAAFDWKVRLNFRRGYRREMGRQVLHFDEGFHGRMGYSMSITNTADPRKTQYYPRFDWPRVVNPKITFPLNDENLARLEKLEALAVAQAEQAFLDHRDDIACIVIEPIQSEGGDNHFRPAFLKQLRRLADENDALLMFDEIQCGTGITGSFWAHQALDVRPDILAFGKKTQVCGIMVSQRIDEVDDHVFRIPGRINSTWGGNLVDMVRFDRVLEVMERDHLVENASDVGAYLIKRLEELQQKYPQVSNARGRGLMCAFELPDKAQRDTFLDLVYDEGAVMIGCGARTVRFRPPLVITREEVAIGIEIIDRALRAMDRTAQ